MSVTTLYDAFVLAAARGTISAEILPLMGKLVAALGVTALPLTDGDPTRTANTARLSGKTSWADGTSWTLLLVGSVDANNQDVLDLTLTARSEHGFVTFATLIPDLPQSLRKSVEVSGTLELTTSVLKPLGPQQAVVSTKAVDDGTAESDLPQLTGILLLTDSELAPYTALLGTSQLLLEGSFDPRAEAEVTQKLNLLADASNASTDWPKMGVEAVGLALTTDYPNTYSFDDPPGYVSAVLLRLTLAVQIGEPHDLVVTVPLLQDGLVWDINGDITPPITLSNGILALLQLFPGAPPSTFSFPPGVAALDAFGLSQLRFGIENSGGTLPVPNGISYTGVTIVSTSAWDVPIPFVRIEEVGSSWLMMWGSTESEWSGSLFGTMRFGSKTGSGEVPPDQAVTDKSGNPVYLNVSASLPDLTIQANTEGAIELDLAAAMGVFFPGSQPDVDASLVVDRISMSASLPTKTYGATLTAHGTWEIPIGDVSFTLDNITFNITVAPATIWGGLAGIVGVYVGGEQKALLSAGAYYPGDGSWQFQGGLADGTLNLTEFVYAFLGQQAPDWLPSLELTRLWASYSTGAGNPYDISAAVAVRWDPEVLGLKLGLVAEAEIKRRPKAQGSGLLAARDTLLLNSLARHRPRLHTLLRQEQAAPTAPPQMIYEGSVKGSFELNNMVITVGLSFVSREQSWLFRLQLDRFALEARTSWTGQGAQRHQVLTVLMEGVKLGDLITSLAALANPNLNYRLPEPWTFLNNINLGRFTLVLDPTEQSVTVNYAINLKLGFITLKSVGLRYARSNGQPQVDIELACNFLGTEYGRGPDMKPLGWDALNDTPPAVPGGGSSLVNLRYLGFGQHVTLDGLTRPNSLAEVIKLMRAQLQPTDDANRNPLDQPSGNKLHFDENSQWLIGLDITLMDTATVKVVMNDPNLYGVLVALAGPQAGALAGFSFELMYKKVTDDIGVFHARLQIPDMFRQLDFGMVVITLGVITVDIFTNGNFKIDLGFPYNRDFSLSFGLQYGPFLGKGGIYFGLLNGATSTRVPAITNGTFSPVLELGIGLAVGVGREFNKGPLKAGMYLQVEVIFEGVLAWFHPDDASTSKALYYWARGTAALVGKVYGKVDFKVISVDVSIEAYAAATLTLAAYQPTLIRLSVGVKVHASIKIVFVRISFSFSMSLDASFTIGSASTTPWVLSADQTGRNVAGVYPSGMALSRAGQGTLPLANASRSGGGRCRAPTEMAHITRGLARARLAARAKQAALHPLALQQQLKLSAATPEECKEGVYHLQFDPAVKVFANGGIESLDVRIVPAFTVAELPVTWPSQSGVAAASDPAYRVVLTLAIDGPAPVESADLATQRSGLFAATARATSSAETPFALLAEGLFRWAISAIGLDPRSATLTAGDLAELAAQLQCPQTFADGFSNTNLSAFLGHNVDFHISGQPVGDAPTTVSGVSFPIPPVLAWQSADLPPPEQTRDFSSYQPVDNRYAAQIAAYFAKLSPQPMGTDAQDGGGISDGESLASVVFREYMLLITKSMVQAAEGLFERFPVTIDGNSTLSAIAASFPTVTVPYVVHLGDTVEQVAATFGYDSVELLALNPNLELELANAAPGSLLQVELGVTPEAIAAANPDRLLAANQTLHAAALETQILEGESPTALCQRLGAEVNAWLTTPAALDTPSITRAGAKLALPAAASVALNGLTLAQAAALFYVRLNAGTAALAAVPEAQWYAEAITQLTGDTIGADGTLPATVKLPSAYDSLAAPIAWTRLAGDTLPLLAATTALWQNPGSDTAFDAWLAELTPLNPNYNGGPLQLPASASALLPDESLRDLATRLLLVVDPIALPATPSAAFRSVVAGVALLAPLASVEVGDCTLTTGQQQTLREFATGYDLSLESVGRVGAEVAGLIVPEADNPLQVPTLAAITLDQLMPALTDDTPVRDAAGQVSRFMLYGLRLPPPAAAADQNPVGLYELIGQQMTGPAPDPEQPAGSPRLTLTLSEGSAVPWISLVQTETVPTGVTLTALTAAQRADLAARNPAVAADRIQPGMILEVGAAETLQIVVTEDMLRTGYPATSLTPVIPSSPAPLQLWEDVPVRHGLPQQVIWQTASRPALPVLGGATAVGMPSFWPFTASLAAIAAAADANPWQLYRTDPQQAQAKAVAVEQFTWASLVDIRLNRIPGRPHTASVVGADTAGRQLLLELWRYLESTPSDHAQLYFGFQLSPAAGLSAGLASTPLNRNATYLVRTNLSTETRSGNFAAGRMLAVAEQPPSGPYFAPLADPLGFLTLLWEASVVGGGGYWLELEDSDGNGFDEAMWGQDGNGVFTLVAVLDSQAQANPQRRLHSFNTAALVGDPIDTSSTTLFVATPDDRDQVRRATVAQGNVGFSFGFTNPPDVGDDPQLRARRLYNLNGYKLEESAVFNASNDGRPVGPQVESPGAGVDALRMAPRLAAQASDDNDQTISQVIPIHRFAKQPSVPNVPGLPPQLEDPYAGISATDRDTPPVATVVLGFHDIFGNSTAPASSGANSTEGVA